MLAALDDSSLPLVVMPDRLDERRAAFVDAMSRAATGVTVVTSDGIAGRFGQTVSAICSVSADPPMLLACINRKSPICDAIQTNGGFGVSVLRADQKRIADSFAGRPSEGEKYDFAASRWHIGVTRSPLLVGAVARFDCELEAVHPAGSHAILVGRVLSASASSGKPLVYASRGYGELFAFPRQRGNPIVAAGAAEDEVDLGEL